MMNVKNSSGMIKSVPQGEMEPNRVDRGRAVVGISLATRGGPTLLEPSKLAKYSQVEFVFGDTHSTGFVLGPTSLSGVEMPGAVKTSENEGADQFFQPRGGSKDWSLDYLEDWLNSDSSSKEGFKAILAELHKLPFKPLQLFLKKALQMEQYGEDLRDEFVESFIRSLGRVSAKKSVAVAIHELSLLFRHCIRTDKQGKVSCIPFYYTGKEPTATILAMEALVTKLLDDESSNRAAKKESYDDYSGEESDEASWSLSDSESKLSVAPSTRMKNIHDNILKDPMSFNWRVLPHRRNGVHLAKGKLCELHSHEMIPANNPLCKEITEAFKKAKRTIKQEHVAEMPKLLDKLRLMVYLEVSASLTGGKVYKVPHIKDFLQEIFGRVCSMLAKPELKQAYGRTGKKPLPANDFSDSEFSQQIHVKVGLDKDEMVAITITIPLKSSQGLQKYFSAKHMNDLVASQLGIYKANFIHLDSVGENETKISFSLSPLVCDTMCAKDASDSREEQKTVDDTLLGNKSGASGGSQKSSPAKAKKAKKAEETIFDKAYKQGVREGLEGRGLFSIQRGTGQQLSVVLQKKADLSVDQFKESNDWFIKANLSDVKFWRWKELRQQNRLDSDEESLEQQSDSCLKNLEERATHHYNAGVGVFQRILDSKIKKKKSDEEGNGRQVQPSKADSDPKIKSWPKGCRPAFEQLTVDHIEDVKLSDVDKWDLKFYIAMKSFVKRFMNRGSKSQTFTMRMSRLFSQSRVRSDSVSTVTPPSSADSSRENSPPESTETTPENSPPRQKMIVTRSPDGKTYSTLYEDGNGEKTLVTMKKEDLLNSYHKDGELDQPDNATISRGNNPGLPRSVSCPAFNETVTPMHAGHLFGAAKRNAFGGALLDVVSEPSNSSNSKNSAKKKNDEGSNKPRNTCVIL